MAKIMVVDDDLVLGEMFVDRLTRLGHDAVSVATLAAAKEKAFSECFDLIFLDVQMPDGNGLVELPRLREAPSAPDVIIITGQGDPNGAETAIKSGAWDYLEKSTAVKDMLLPLSRVLKYRQAKEECGQHIKVLKRKAIVGNSQALNKCLDQVARVASSDASVLLSGETGVGKELFAKVIHENSHRATKNFVVVDCASLPETLVESTLFGHVKGAFTGADGENSGLLKQADGGTLFLDEVGEMDLVIQKKFLRALQEQQFRPVGSNKEVTSDFRVVAASNKNLDDMVAKRAFRSDLLFRLKAMAIELPSLRDRQDDITDLAFAAVHRLCLKYGLEQKGLAPDFLEEIKLYGWPGNVRELMNSMEVAVSNGQYEPILYSTHLPEALRVAVFRASMTKKKSGARPVPPPEKISPPSPDYDTLPAFKAYRDEALEQVEKEYLQRLVRLTQGNVKLSCEISELGRTRLYTLLKKHDVSRFGWDN